MISWHPDNMYVSRFYTVHYKPSKLVEVFRGRFLGTVNSDGKLHLRFETLKNATRICEIPVYQIQKVEG